MRIENSAESITTSNCLKTFADLARANLDTSVTVTTGQSGFKNDLILEIILAIGTGLASSAIYDLLKLAIRQHISQITNDDYIVIDGVKISLIELFNSNPKLKDNFDDTKNS